MLIRTLISLVAIAVALISTDAGVQQTASPTKSQRPHSTAASARVEPLRVINGELRANTIDGKFRKGIRTTKFSLTLMRADLINGVPRLRGHFKVTGAQTLGEPVTASIGGAMSEAANPWPNARDSRPASSQEERDDCSAVFLKLTVPQRIRAALGSAQQVQVGFIASFTDKNAARILAEICRLRRAGDQVGQDSRVEGLNLLLASARR